MDEVMNAVDDAQFVSAATGRQAPTAKFTEPTPPELEAFKSGKCTSSKNSEYFELCYLLESTIGLYTFVRYLKTLNDESINHAVTFLEDTISYRKCVGLTTMAAEAETINLGYFKGSTGRKEKEGSEGMILPCYSNTGDTTGLQGTKAEQSSNYDACWGKGTDGLLKLGGAPYEVRLLFVKLFIYVIC